MYFQYKDKNGNIIGKNEIPASDNYFREFIVADEIQYVETLLNQEVQHTRYFNTNHESHKTILERSFKDGWFFHIVESRYIGQFRHYKIQHYDKSHTLCVLQNEIYNAEGEIIGWNWIEDLETMQMEADASGKIYYDRNIRPDSYLFLCKYDTHGKLLPIVIDIEELGYGGQDSIWIYPDGEGVMTLMKLTGMPRELAEYYTSNTIVPDDETL